MLRILTFTAALVLAAAPAFASDRDEVLAPIKAFVAAINKGDMNAAAITHVDGASIIDEFPPHHWTSLSAWAADYAKDSQVESATDGRLIMHKVHRVKIEGDAAYVVAPTDYAYKAKGKPMIEHGTITYALTHAAGGWKIAAWSFSW
jgi:ketosteroid isomerase-like protein